MSSYQAYAYTSGDQAYVGITRSPELRHAAHRKRGPVSQLQSPTLTILEDGLCRHGAQAMERLTIASYRRAGWKLLNRSKGGELGGRRRLAWTLDQLVVAASAFSSRTAFCRGAPNLYGYALDRGLLDRLAKRLGWPDHQHYRWLTLEACLKEARRHPTLKDWRLKSRPSYSAAMRRGWAAEIKARLFPQARQLNLKPEVFSPRFNCYASPTKCGLRLRFSSASGLTRFEKALEYRLGGAGYPRPGNRLLLPLGLAHAAMPLLGVVIPGLRPPGRRTPTFA